MSIKTDLSGLLRNVDRPRNSAVLIQCKSDYLQRLYTYFIIKIRYAV